MPHGMHALNAQHRISVQDAVHRMHLTGCTTSNAFHMDVRHRMHCIGYNGNDNVVIRYYNKKINVYNENILLNIILQPY